MSTAILAPIVLGVLGIIFGAILAFASKVFAVEKDPREEAIVEILPGANCGGCGYPGCGGYANAVVKGIAPVNSCSPGGADLAVKIGEIMGVEAEVGARKIAQVQCSGKGCDKLRYEYVGLQDCRAMARVSSGPLQCSYACLGGGTCEEACQFNAIHVVDGVAVVDKDECVACNKCVEVCPRNIIKLVPLKTKKYVVLPCSSQDKGAVARKACDNGCIGCSLCVKACPKDAITVENFLAKIDYDKCIGCGLCSRACPRQLITVDGKVLPPLPKKEPAAKPAAAAATPKTEEAKTPAPKADSPVADAAKAEESKAAPSQAVEAKAEAPKAEV